VLPARLEDWYSWVAILESVVDKYTEILVLEGEYSMDFWLQSELQSLLPVQSGLAAAEWRDLWRRFDNESATNTPYPAAQ
jgi:hypothetical protein